MASSGNENKNEGDAHIMEERRIIGWSRRRDKERRKEQETVKLTWLYHTISLENHKGRSRARVLVRKKL